MAGEGDLGSLYFTLGLNDNDFKTKMAGLSAQVEKALNGSSSGNLSPFKKMSKDVSEVIDKTRSLAVVSGTVDDGYKEAVAECVRLKKELDDIKASSLGLATSIDKENKARERGVLAAQKQIELSAKIAQKEQELADKVAALKIKQQRADENLVQKILDGRSKIRAKEDTDGQATIARANRIASAQKQALNNSISKGLTGSMLETTGDIGKRSDAIKSLNSYYRDQELITRKQGQASDKAAATATKHANATRGLGASLLFSNGQMSSSVRLSGALSNQMGMLFSVYAAERFVKALVDIRGQFEMQQVSLRAILQDAGAADKIFTQIQTLAVKSPFQFLDLVSYAKQLAAFSVPAKELFETTKMLSDVSAGLGVDMSRMILAYGQVKAASVLRGQELRQFTEAGIPLVAELAKKFEALSGVATTTGDVFDKISKREVPFAMVSGIFNEMTSAGGKFYKMQEIQSETLKGKISNLVDAYQISLNKLGKSQDDVLKDGADLAMRMATNLEPIIKVLGTLILTWGLYKAAQMAAMVPAFFQNIAAQISAVKQLRVAVTELTTAQQVANAATKANLYIAIAQGVAVAIGLITSAFFAFHKEAKSSQEIIDELTSSTSRLGSAGSDLDKLLEQYDKLGSEMKSGKLDTESYTEAKRKHDVVVNEMIKLVPEATIREKEYGDIIGINIKKVKEYSEEQKKNALLDAKIKIEASKTQVNKLREEQKILNESIDKFKTQPEWVKNTPRISSSGSIGSKKNESNLSQYVDNAEKLKSLNESIASSEATISAIGQKEVATAEILTGWRLKYNDAVSKLGEKYKITEEEASKSGSEIAKSRTEDYQKDLADYNAMTHAKLGTFTSSEIAKQKELVRTDKLAAEYAGGNQKENSRTESAASKAKAASAKRQEAVERDMLTLKNISEKAEITLADAKLSAQDEGYLKQKQQQKIKFDEEKLRIEKQGQDMLELQNKIEVNKFIKNNPNYVKERKSLPKSTVLNAENQKAYDDFVLANELENKASTEKLLKDKLIEYGDYAAERLAIEKKFNADIAALESERTAENGAQIDSARIQAGVDKAKALMTQSFEKLSKSPEFAMAFQDLDTVSSSTLEKLINELERLKTSAAGILPLKDLKVMFKFLDEATDKFIKSNPFKALKNSAEELKLAGGNVADKNKTLKNVQSGMLVADGAKDGQIQFKSLAKAEKEATDAEDDLAEKRKKHLKITTELIDQTKELFNELDNIGSAMGGQAGEIISAISNIGTFVTTSIAGITSMSAAAAVQLSIVEKASVILSIIGAAITVVTTVVNLFTSASKKRADALKAEATAQRQAYLGLIDYNIALRKQYDWTKKISETRLEWYKREGDELSKQIEANKKLQTDLSWSQAAHDIKYIYSQTKTKNSTTTQYSTLAGMSVEELAKLVAEGRLDQAGQDFYELMKKAADEGKDLAKAQDEYFESVREMFTGTTYQTIADSIIDGFKEGKRSAADFADTFEQLMQGAVQSALSMTADAGIRKWYEDFATSSESGGILTPEEQLALKESWSKLIENLGVQADNLETITGKAITSSTTSASGLKGEVPSTTEATSSRLVGLLNTIRADVSAKNANLKIMVDAHLGGGINVFDTKANAQLVDLNAKMAASNVMVESIQSMIGSVITQGSKGKAFRVL